MLMFALFVLQLLLLIALVIGLHHARKQIGLTPLLLFVASLMVFLSFSPFVNMRFFLTPDIRLGVAGHVIAPVILMSLLIVYIADGSRLARFQMVGLIGVNLVAIGMLGFGVLYRALDPGTLVLPPANDGTAIDLVFLWRRVASAVAFTGAMIIATVTFQFCKNRLQKIPDWLVIGAALVFALWMDSLVFFVVSGIGLAPLFNDLLNDLLGKMTASTIVLVPMTFYLMRVVRKSPDYQTSAGRPVLSILLGDAGRLQAAVKYLESELRVSRTIYRELTEHIGEIFWMVDVQTQQFLYLSPAFERITGYERTPFYQNIQHIRTLLPPETHIERDGLLALLYDVHPQEIRIIRADGTRIWIRNRAFTIKDEAGEIYRYAGVIEDITAQKTAQQRSFELAVASERVNILHDFIRDASHDLRSPLGAILIKLQILERQIEDQKQQSIIDELKRRVMNLSKLIDDLFALSRIESGDPTGKTQLDLGELLGDVISEFRPLAQEKGLALAYQPATNVTLSGNADQLRRVVSNLIANAIRYSHEGTITVKLVLIDDTVVFTVRDAGIGIPEVDIAHIFRRFYRTDNAKVVSKSGTGLGLAIVRAIVDQHGGEIDVQSALDEGSTFTVTLPIEGKARPAPTPDQA